MPLVQLVFLSSFIDDHGRDLMNLLVRSSLGSQACHVKGMTLFSNGNILQLLQGEMFAVAKLFHTLPSQTNQFQVIKMTEEVIFALSLHETCLGFDKKAFGSHLREFTGIPFFRFNASEISQRIGESEGRDLSMQFVELHA